MGVIEHRTGATVCLSVFVLYSNASSFVYPAADWYSVVGPPLYVAFSLFSYFAFTCEYIYVATADSKHVYCSQAKT